MIRTVVLTGMVGAIAASVGCGTLFNEETETLRIESNPSGATVYVDGEPEGRTPANVSVRPEHGVWVEVKKVGRGSARKYVGQTVGALWVFADVLGGVVPLLVDAISGGWYELEKNTVYLYIGDDEEE